MSTKRPTIKPAGRKHIETPARARTNSDDLAKDKGDPYKFDETPEASRRAIEYLTQGTNNRELDNDIGVSPTRDVIRGGKNA